MENHLPNVAASEFLEYVALLENELENKKSQMDITRRIQENERACLKAKVGAVLAKLKEARQKSQTLKDFEDQTKLIVSDMKNDFFETECLLEEELKCEKVLDEKIHNLEVELEMKNNLLDHRWRRHEKARQQLENENAVLRRKARLGWILGCLSEVYMLSESKGAVTPLLRMVKSIQGDFESENMVANCTHKPLHVRLEHVGKEIVHLINSTKVLQQPSKSKNDQLVQNRKEPCFIVTAIKPDGDRQGMKSEGEACQEMEGGHQEEAGEAHKMPRPQAEKSKSEQEEIKQMLARLEAGIMQLLQSKQGTEPVPSGQEAWDSSHTHAPGEEQQLNVQERSIDDVILRRAHIPSRRKNTPKAKH